MATGVFASRRYIRRRQLLCASDDSSQIEKELSLILHGKKVRTQVNL